MLRRKDEQVNGEAGEEDEARNCRCAYIFLGCTAAKAAAADMLCTGRSWKPGWTHASWLTLLITPLPMKLSEAVLTKG